MARQCGVCKRPPREGEEMRPMRLLPEDLAEVDTCTEEGLYSACLECLELHRQRVAQRTGQDIQQISNNALC